MQVLQDSTLDERIIAFESAKMTLRDERTRSLYCEQVRIGLDKSEQVWSAIFPQPWVAHSPNWAHPKPACRFLTVPRSKLNNPPKWWKQRFNWHKVWNGVKCNFSSAHFQKRYVVGKLSISWVRMCNFTRIGPKTKKLWLSIIPALRRSHQPHLGQCQKGVNRNFSWPHLDKSYVVRNLSISEA